LPLFKQWACQSWEDQFGSGIRLMLQSLRATTRMLAGGIVDIVEARFDKVSILLTL
jgi:hypothetical protein